MKRLTTAALAIIHLKSSMQFAHLFKTAITGLIVNRVRSALTILGIVIGVTAIILIVSLGQGAQQLILGELQSLGADTIIIRPGQEPTGPTDVAGTIFADSLKIKDIDALKRKSNVPELVDIAPAVVVTGSVSYLGETDRPTIIGWSAEFMSRMMDVYPEKGILFSESDIRSRASVAVIGADVAKELFKDQDPIGKTIKIRDRGFRVVGVFPKHGQSTLFNIDKLVILPYTTAQSYLLGIDYYNEVMVKVTSPDVVERSVLDIEDTIRASHHITDPKKDDFFVVTQEGAVAQIGLILNVLTFFLASVVAISLIVGGIGVMNIMLVSVTERTREIGLRKALGATDKNILVQFLIEAIVLTGVGGLIGIVLGTLFAFIAAIGLSSALNVAWDFTFPFTAAFLGIGVSGIVGLVFGLYPARKASLKSPIEALRYE